VSPSPLGADHDRRDMASPRIMGGGRDHPAKAMGQDRDAPPGRQIGAGMTAAPIREDGCRPMRPSGHRAPPGGPPLGMVRPGWGQKHAPSAGKGHSRSPAEVITHRAAARSTAAGRPRPIPPGASLVYPLFILTCHDPPWSMRSWESARWMNSGARTDSQDRMDQEGRHASGALKMD
jgi:hypothetical protein